MLKLVCIFVVFVVVTSDGSRDAATEGIIVRDILRTCFNDSKRCSLTVVMGEDFSGTYVQEVLGEKNEFRTINRISNKTS